MIDREELLEKYAGTEKDFTGRRRGGLRDKTIRGGIYREADFSGRYFDLRGAKKLIIESCKNIIFYETIIPDGSIRTDNPSN